MRKFSKLEGVLVLVLALSAYINYQALIDLEEKHDELIGVMANYGEAVEKLSQYEPDNSHWIDQLQSVKEWFDTLNTTRYYTI